VGRLWKNVRGFYSYYCPSPVTACSVDAAAVFSTMLEQTTELAAMSNENVVCNGRTDHRNTKLSGNKKTSGKNHLLRVLRSRKCCRI